MSEWLEIQADSGKYEDLQWINKQQGLLQLPWKHGSSKDWDEEMDAKLFVDWAKHTGW